MNVTKAWIDGLPEIPYTTDTGTHNGVTLHFTDSPGDTAASERTWEAAHYGDAFVHEFIDPTSIIQVANPAFIAYGAGFYARRFIHLELCHADILADFNASYIAWCQRAATYLYANRLGVTPAHPDGSGTLWAHADVTHYLGGTTHTDPIDYLKRWGVTWNDVIAEVTSCYNQLADADKPEVLIMEPWKIDALKWLADNGYVKADAHDPNANVTWAELSVIVQRAADPAKRIKN